MTTPSSTLLTFASREIWPQVLSVLHYNPTRVVLLHTDESANAAAKASASRTLLEYFDDRDSARATRRGVDMTASELDAAIALLE